MDTVDSAGLTDYVVFVDAVHIVDTVDYVDASVLWMP